MKYHLQLRTHVDLELLEQGVALREVRLLANASLTGTSGALPPRSAIVDTGGPVSVIPRRVWRDAEYEALLDSQVTISLAGSAVQAQLATVSLRIHDGDEISPPLVMKAYLLSDDSHPFLLGFEDFLTDVDLFVSFIQNHAFVEFPPVSLSDRQ